MTATTGKCEYLDPFGNRNVIEFESLKKARDFAAGIRRSCRNIILSGRHPDGPWIEVER